MSNYEVEKAVLSCLKKMVMLSNQTLRVDRQNQNYVRHVECEYVFTISRPNDS